MARGEDSGGPGDDVGAQAAGVTQNAGRSDVGCRVNDALDTVQYFRVGEAFLDRRPNDATPRVLLRRSARLAAAEAVGRGAAQKSGTRFDSPPRNFSR